MANVQPLPRTDRSKLRLQSVDLIDRVGRVTEMKGNTILADGPDAFLGELCTVSSQVSQRDILAEVVGFHHGSVCLTPFERPHGVALGAKVVAHGHPPRVPVGDGLLGRVVNALGEPIDGLGPLPVVTRRSLHGEVPGALTRERIREPLSTGIKAIDTFLTLGRGQRVGLFAGSGVGKSTLLGMINRGVTADVNVVALIGERTREVKEFIEDHLVKDGNLARSVIVVATAEQSAILRVNAAHYAMAIAEHFRDQNCAVLLTMDSLTRFAMARREIGLAAGEPATSRGYTPSVFAELPALCERCGTSEGRGSVTGIFTVLVEGDDFNEPVSDLARATLDGHIVLSRELASSGHYPPIDVLQSCSRLAAALRGSEQNELIGELLDQLALFERNRQLIEIGAYRHGNNPKVDRAVVAAESLGPVLRQQVDVTVGAADSWAQLRRVVVDQLGRS